MQRTWTGLKRAAKLRRSKNKKYPNLVLAFHLASVSPNSSINDQLELALVAPAFGAMIGCWLGAIPIPLDWDRPWQVSLSTTASFLAWANLPGPQILLPFFSILTRLPPVSTRCGVIQAWPTTCVVGTIAGHALGSLLGLAGCVLWPDQTRSAASKLKKAL